MSKHKIRVLIGKPGLDGHDHGAKVVVRALMEAGFEVIYTGLRKTPEEIVQAAIAANADVIGLSSMAGSHLPFCVKLKPLLEQNDLAGKLWIIGGVIPDKDHAALREIGLNGIFPTGTRFEEMARFIEENAK